MTSATANRSPSVQEAIEWASVAARLWATDEPALVEPEDLLVGLLLAHPDRDGEVWALLDHFGLTVRDVLPPDYPAVNLDDLAVRARAFDPAGIVLSPVTESLLGGDSALQVVDVLGTILESTSPLTTTLAAALSSRGVAMRQLIGSYRDFLATDPGRQTMPAGRLLRDWLAARLPRTPVDVPTYASDRIDANIDLIGVQTEADALAYLIAARDLAPPLAVGLFGDWGSGKSFLMRAVQHRIHDLTEQAQLMVDGSPVWGDVRQIEFNAWEYVQGNIWAGLLARIFAELGTLPEPSTVVEAAQQPVVAALAVANASVDAATASHQQSTQMVKTKEAALSNAQAEENAARKNADKKASDPISTARTILTEYWGESRARLLGLEGADAVEALTETGRELQRGRALLGPYWSRPGHVVLVTAGLVIVCGVAALPALFDLPPALSLFGGLAALVPLVTVTLRHAATWARGWLTRVENAQAKLRAQLILPVKEAQQRVEAARSELAAAQAEKEATERRLHEAEAVQVELKRRKDELTPARVLVEFADKRSDDYRRLLGPIATIREDLRSVEQQILDYNSTEAAKGSGTAGMPNRIVLYVDDLDRCPPPTVVEVLEAIHLLLSFQIFVVVAAVDQRWLTAALVDQLPSLAPDAEGKDDDHAGPAEYLEKIFQLPFLVPPLTAPARGQLLRGLLSPSVRDRASAAPANGNGTGMTLGDARRRAVLAMLARRGSGMRLETSALTLSGDDLKTIESFAPLIGNTPRRVKRFVNVCQLLLAMPPRLSGDGSYPTDRHAVCFLAALSEGLPTVAAALFDALQGTVGHPQTVRLGAWTPTIVDPAEHEAFAAWLRATPGWSETTLSRLSAVATRTEMIGRLRFTELPRLAASADPQP